MKNIVENQGIKNDKPVPLSYEQLKQQLDAVVAECADLKTCAIGWAELYADEMGDPHITEDALPKTPNVTAALAEVEAKAIEKLADEQKEKSSSADRAGMKHLSASHEFAEIQARAYVAKMREGRV
ncbi:hypothetical protein [Serratia fonticola]|uniref:hypothetical protein n=1 Tax=Serratia fonticola TaxID=47917 RepID=UPI0034C67DC6